MAETHLLNSLGSYFTPNDGNRHAIVSTPDGEVHEIFYNPKTGKGNAKLAAFCGIRHLGAFYTPDDEFQHPIVATATGDIFEIYFKPGNINVTGSLANFSSMVALSGFYAADDHMRILIVGQDNGQIHEVFYNPGIGIHVTQPPLATFPGLTHVAAFYTGDDKFRHAIVATRDGNITEVFYHSTIGVHVSEPPLANFANIASLAAFYAEDDRMRIVIVATKDGTIHEIFYRPDIGVHVTQPALATLPGITAISAFYTADDKFRHVIATDTAGNVTEVFYHSTIGVHVSEPPLASFPAPAPVFEMVGPDLANISASTRQNIGGTSPSGRCVALAGSAGELYTMGHTGGVWKSLASGAWALQQGAPAPADIFGARATLAVSAGTTAHAVAGSDGGLWETTSGGATWSQALDPASLGAGSSQVTGAVFDDADRLFVGVDDGLAIRAVLGSPFEHVKLGTSITAIAFGDNKVWARSASALFVSENHGSTWSPAIAIPGTIRIRPKEQFALAATDNFAYMIATRAPGETGCGGDNLLVVFNAATNAWSTQTVLSSDLAAWHQSQTGQPGDSHTCDGTGGDSSVDGARFIKSVRLRDSALSDAIGQRIQILYGSGQEVWRARAANGDGTITDWNWVVGTQGFGFSNRDPVHADIWDAHVDPDFGGRRIWVAGDGGVYTLTVAAPDYEVPADRSWQPAMAGLHTHQIQTLTLLRTDAVGRPRLVYAIGDSGAFWRDTSRIVMPEAPWDSRNLLGDGNFTMGDSSAPLYAQLIRQLTVEGFLEFPSSLTSAWLINPKTTAFIDPSVPTRFRFVPSPWQDGQFGSADVVMMVDLPLTFQQNNIDVPFPTQPGPSSNGGPVLIRNRNFDANPDINAANAKGKGWALERGSLPLGIQGFAVSGDRTRPIYYAFDNSTLYAERDGGWTPVLRNLVNSQTFGAIFANPYDSRVIFALTSDQNIVVSSDSGSTFTPDRQLNALVGRDVSKVNQIAFNYDRPLSVAACTENGQVFHSYTNGVWQDLTGHLPSPLIPIRSIALDCEAIYLGTFGRGLMRIVHYGGPAIFGGGVSGQQI
jgi:hypothetical protein